MDFQRQAASLQIKHVVHLIPCHGLVHSKSWGLTCPTRTCWHACGKRMDSMTSSCVNGALCCPTRGRYWKISAEGFHDVLQNLSCPKQFRLCRQVQLFIVVFYSSPSFFLPCWFLACSLVVARKDVTRLSTAQIVSEMVEVLRTGHAVKHL